MKVKIKIPFVLKGGETARIAIYAEIDALVLSTTDTKTAIVEIQQPVIEVV